MTLVRSRLPSLKKETPCLSQGNWVTSVRTIAADITEGFLEITHNSFALIGLIVAFAAVALFAHPDLRAQGEVQLRTWLQDRYVADVGLTPEPEAIERATASNPKELPQRPVGCRLLDQQEVQSGC